MTEGGPGNGLFIGIIHGFKDPKDFAAGYKYLVNPDDEYIVPNWVGLDR